MGHLVLVIDDSLTVCKVIEVCLCQAGYEVHSCPDGPLALQWLRSVGRIPDLIFVDLLLPKMDGYSLIQHLRAQPNFRQIPFVIITRYDGFIDKLKGMLVGASAYVVKPLKTADLVSIVQTYLGVPASLPDTGGVVMM